MDSKQKNNLLFISTEFPPGPGGIGNHAWNLARNLNKKISVDVLTVSNYSSKEECLAFDRSEKIKIIRFKKYYFSLLTYMHRIYTIVNKVKTDKQLKILDRATDMAIRQVEKERRGKERDYFIEWFRYIELAGKKLNKYIN